MCENGTFSKFLRSIKSNDHRSFSCYLRRARVINSILLQKLGKNTLVKVPLFNGQKMNVITGETVSKNLIAFGYTEIALTALMLKKLNAGDTFVDIGTHYGYEALVANSIVGQTGTVYSFEPNPISYGIAKKNIKQHNSILYNYAVGDYNGTAKMQSNAINESAFNSIADDVDSNNLIDVRIVTLDSILKDRKKAVNFIKCDVEGFELQVLKGAKEIIDNDKPLIVLEADMPTNNMPSDRALILQDYMKNLGYNAYNFDLLESELKIDTLGSFPVGHANILFQPV